MTSDIKPAAFARGVPKAASNGIFGIESDLIASPETQIVTVTVYAVDEIIDKEIKGEKYPVIRTLSIEPLHDPDAIASALKLAAAAKSERGDTELEIPLPDEPDLDLDTPLAEKLDGPAAIAKGPKK